MHFSTSLFTGAVILGLSTQTYGQAAVDPALGVTGTLQGSDVQAPTNANPCGNVNVQQSLATSKFLQPDAKGIVATTATNFQAQAAGSMQFTMLISPSASTADMIPGTILSNGPNAPPQANAFAPIVAQVPTGMRCTGGPTGDMCLASFTSTSGFGNCVVIRQVPVGAGAAPAVGAPNAVVGAAPAAIAPAVGAAPAVVAASPAIVGAAPAVIAPAVGAAPVAVAPAPISLLNTNPAPVRNGGSSGGVVSSFSSSTTSAGGNTKQVVAINNGGNSVIVTKNNNGPAQVIAGRTLLARQYREREAAGLNTENVVGKRSWSSWIWA